METEAPNPKPIPFFKRFISLGIGTYFFLSFFPFPLTLLAEFGGTVPFEEEYDKFWLPAARWVAGTFFGDANSVILQPTGAGDTMYQNMVKLFWVMISCTIALIWCATDRKGKTYERAIDLFRVNVRFLLVSILFGYGFGKLSQYPAISDFALDTTWGETSPMGVIWKMMMSNQNYTAFVGLLEASPGFLLLFRRTQFLGGLLTAGVMFHIFTLNVFYDIPVKLHSLHYILMGLWIGSPIFKNLFNVLVLHRPTEAQALLPEVRVKWLRYATIAFGFLFWGYYTFNSANGWYTSVRKLSEPKAEYMGSWEIRSYLQDGQELIAESNKPWLAINFASDKAFVLLDKDKTRHPFMYELDASKKVLKSTNFESKEKADLAYEVEGNNITIQGKIFGKQAVVIARRTSADRVIFSKPIRWVSEKPDHR
jgi:hypothetical protein